MPKVDFSNYEGREQAYVKHCLLESYLPELAYKVGSIWDSIVYVDGFAGPWQTKHPNYADSSFGVAVNALRECQIGLRETRGRDLHVKCILVEQDKVAFEHLQQFASGECQPNFIVRALPGDFATNIPKIEQIVQASGRSPFRFIFLDPTGWAQIPMDKLRPLLRHRSCEVLVNLMTRHINRFLDQPDRAESYQRLFGRSDVIQTLRNTPPQVRAEQSVFEYSKSLKQLCGFKYVSAAVILDPNQESVRYYLVYATNHSRGIEVFKAGEIKAAKIQDDVRFKTHVQKSGPVLPGLFSDGKPPRSPLVLELQQRYARIAWSNVMDALLSNLTTKGSSFSDIFCLAMALPLVTPNHLLAWLNELKPNIEIILAEPKKRQKPSPMEDDRIVVVNPNALRQRSVR